MAVEIVKVVRVNGKAVRVVAEIGDIEIRYVRLEGSEEPCEESKMRYGVQILDDDTLRIPNNDFQKLQKTVKKIFSEKRVPKKRSQESTQRRLIS